MVCVTSLRGRSPGEGTSHTGNCPQAVFVLDGDTGQGTMEIRVLAQTDLGGSLVKASGTALLCQKHLAGTRWDC